MSGLQIGVWGRDGVVTSEGPRLCGWQGLAATWAHDLDTRAIRLCGLPDGVLVLDEQGVVHRVRGEDGAILATVAVGTGRPTALDASGDTWVVATSHGVWWCTRGQVVGEVALPQVVDVALHPTGDHAALLDEAGTLTVIDLVGGQATARRSVGGRPFGVCWHPDGYWLVGAGEHLVAVRLDGDEVAAPFLHGIRHGNALAVALGGLVAVVPQGKGQTCLVHLEERERLDGWRVGREVRGVAVPGPPEDDRCLIAVAGGDVVQVGLLTGRAEPLAPAPGRVPRPPSIDVRFDAARLRGARAQRLAAGAPLAEAQAVVVETRRASRGRTWRWIGAAAGLLLFLGALAWWLL